MKRLNVFYAAFSFLFLGLLILSSCKKDAAIPAEGNAVASNSEDKPFDIKDLELDKFWEMNNINVPEEKRLEYLLNQRDIDHSEVDGVKFKIPEATEQEKIEDAQPPGSSSSKKHVDLSSTTGKVWNQSGSNVNHWNPINHWYYKNSCQSHGMAAMMTHYVKKNVNSYFTDRSPYYFIWRHVQRNNWYDWWRIRRNMDIAMQDGCLPEYHNNDSWDCRNMYDGVWSVSVATSPSNKKIPGWRYIMSPWLQNYFPSAQGTPGNRIKHIVRDYEQPVVISVFLDKTGDHIKLVNNQWGYYQVSAGLHIMTVVGYSDYSKLFKIKNSWGDSWFGQGGYFYCTKGVLNWYLYEAATYTTTP